METRCAVGHPAVAGRRFSIGKRVEVVPSVFFSFLTTRAHLFSSVSCSYRFLLMDK